MTGKDTNRPRRHAAHDQPNTPTGDRPFIEHPERFSAAAGIHARRAGAPDPQLLALAGSVLRWLPRVATRPAEAGVEGDVSFIDILP